MVGYKDDDEEEEEDFIDSFSSQWWDIKYHFFHFLKIYHIVLVANGGI